MLVDGEMIPVDELIDKPAVELKLVALNGPPVRTLTVGLAVVTLAQ